MFLHSAVAYNLISGCLPLVTHPPPQDWPYQTQVQKNTTKGNAFFLCRIFKGQKVVADSGNKFDDTLKGGGRLGVFAFSQEQLIWSDLAYSCQEKLPQEVYDELPAEKQREVSLLHLYCNPAQVEVDEQLPWKVTGNSVRWGDSVEGQTSARSMPNQGTSRAQKALENSHLYNTETQKCYA